MTKESYFYNSSKLMFTATFLLLISNLSLFLKTVSPWFEDNCVFLYDKLPILTFVIFSLLAFVAVNGECVAYRRERCLKSRKTRSRLKFYILLNIIFLFAKSSLVKAALKTNQLTPGGALFRIGVSIVTVVISYSFFLLLLLIVYRFRDRSVRKLAIIENIAIGFSAFYELFRIINFSINDYDVDFFGGVVSRLFSSSVLMNALCIIQYVLVAVALIFIRNYYSSASALADEKKKNAAKNAVTASMIFLEKRFGVDSQDDDWVLSEESTATADEIITE